MWNSGTGATAAEAIDSLGGFRQRGSSINLEDGPGSISSRVPLLDFRRVKILSSAILGAGSSAKVYEGRWCNKKCAVKVLFSVELSKDEIERCCEEARLLHSIADPHVLKIFGVSVMPPSLCLVLELCDAGSLDGILYNKADFTNEGSQRSAHDTTQISLHSGISITSGVEAKIIPGMENTGTNVLDTRFSSYYKIELDSTYLRRLDTALGVACGKVSSVASLVSLSALHLFPI